MNVFDDTEATARQVTVPPKTGEPRVISFSGESVGGTDTADYFTFVAPKDGWFYAETQRLSGANVDLRFTGTDGAGRLIIADDIADIGGEPNRNFIYNRVQQGETYYLEVSPPFSGGSTLISGYDLDIVFSEDNESFADATEISVNAAFENQIFRGDPQDYYFIAPEQSGTVVVTLSNLSDSPSLNFTIPFVQIAVYDSFRQLITSDLYREGDTTTLNFDVLAGQEYFIVLTQAPNTELLAFFADDGSYTLATELTAIPPDNNETFASAMAQETSFSIADEVGGTDPGDVYALAPTSNGIVALTLSGLLNDADILIYDADGESIAQSRAGGTSDEAIEFAVTEDQTYFVRVVSKEGGPTPYTLDSTFTETAPADGDIAATSADALTVGLGSVVESDLDSTSDRDWFKITVPDGATYVLRAEGAESEIGTLEDPDLVVRRANESFFSQDTGNPDQPAEVTLSDPGTYFVSARSYSGGTGTYELSVTTPSGRIAPDSATDIAGDTSSTAALTIGAPIVSQIDSNGESDWFKVSVADSEELTVFVEGAASDKGTLTDPILVLRDEDGAFISQTHPSAGQNAQTTIEMPGEYWLQVTASEGYTGSYTITASSDALPILSESSDFAADNSSNAVIVAGQQAHANLDAVGDKDWIKVTMETGQRLDVTVTGRGDEDTRLNDPDVIIRTESGGFVSQDFGNPGEPASVTIASAGTYWIEVRSFSGDTGDYAVSVTDTFAENSSAAAESYVSTAQSEDIQIVDTSGLS